MTMLPVVTAPNSVLSQTAKNVAKIDDTTLSLVEEMKHTLGKQYDPEGVGLAAPQVGKSLRIFIVKATPKDTVKVFINPVRLEASDMNKISDRVKKPTKKSRSVKLEGCLSLPTIWGTVARQPTVNLSYMDLQGKTHQKVFRGFIATIIQHEIDHLDGILFPKRVLEQQGILYKSHKNPKGEDEFEEIDL